MRFLTLMLLLIGGASAGVAWQRDYGWQDLRADVQRVVDENRWGCDDGASATWRDNTSASFRPNLAPSADRTSYDEIRGTEYRSSSERTWFLAHCITPAAPASVAEQEPASTPDCNTIADTLPHYQWPAECVYASWVPFDCDKLRYRPRVDSGPPSGWREWYIANCNPPPRDESGLPPYRVRHANCWTTLQPLPAMLTRRLILRGEVITEDTVRIGEAADCPKTEGENEQRLEAVVGTRALTDIGPGQAVRLDAHCRASDEEVYGVPC